MRWGLAAKAVGVVFGAAIVGTAVMGTLFYCAARAASYLDHIHDGLGLLALLTVVVIGGLCLASFGLYTIFKTVEEGVDHVGL